MPTLQELLEKHRASQPKAAPNLLVSQPYEEEGSRFFPGGLGWNALGALDLVLGAPARAVQGGILSGMRGENVVGGAVRSGLGFSLDGKKWGAGEVASGIELLEELGMVHDKENIGNIIAGIGTDIATDLITFNVVGAVRKGIIGGGSTFARTLVHPGIKGTRKVALTARESRILGRKVLGKMDVEHLRSIVRDTGLSPNKVVGKTKGGGAYVRKDWNKYLSIDNVKLRYRGDPSEIQELLQTPSLEQMGRAAGMVAEKNAVSAPMSMIDNFDVADVSLSNSYMGTNRPSSIFEMSFSDRRMLKSAMPAGSVKYAKDLEVRLSGKPLKASWMKAILPAHLNPFDFTTLLRRVGIMGNLFRGHNKVVEESVKIFNEIKGPMKSLGLHKQSNRQRLFDAAFYADRGNWDAFNKLSKGEQAFLHKMSELKDRVADIEFLNPKTGKIQKGLPDEMRRQGFHVHMIRRDFKQQTAKDFVHISNDGSWKVPLMGEAPGGVKMAGWMERGDELADVTKYHRDIVDSFTTYITGGLRKVYLEPELVRVLPDIERLNQMGNTDLYRTAQKAVQNFFGHYSDLDGWFDDLVRKIPGASRVVGDSSNLFTRASLSMTSATYRAMLGLNPRTTLLQLMQGVVNNTMHLGMCDSIKGFFKAVNPAHRVPRASKIMNEFMFSWDKEFRKMTPHGKVHGVFEAADKVLFSGLNSFDNFNRGWAFHGGYSLAKRHGLSEEMAMLQGIHASNATQFIYGKLGASPLRSHPLGRLLMQFQSYTMKQLDFMSREFSRNPMKNMLRYVAISGFVARHVGKHIDIDSDLVPLTPGDAKNLITMKRVPALTGLKAIVDFGAAVTEEAAGVNVFGRSQDPRFVKEQAMRAFLTSMVPMGTMISRGMKYMPTLSDLPPEKQFFMARSGAEGAEVDKYGRKIRDITKPEAALGMIGFKSRQSKNDRSTFEDVQFGTDWFRDRKGYMMSQALRAIQNGRDPTPWIQEVRELTHSSVREIRQALKQRLRNRRMSLVERARKRTPKAMRR